MRHLGICLMVGSIAAAACASHTPPPAASSNSVELATNEPNRGPDFAPASSDGVATAGADVHRTNGATQPAPTLNPPADTAANNAKPNSGNTWGNGADGASGVDPATTNAAGSPIDRPSQPTTDADNTRINKRDRNAAALTPMDQGSSESDRRITQQIRQEVIKDKTLSFTAKNVKIITLNGMVTLRGPVKSEAERTAIEAVARRIAGSGAQVNSLLELSK